MVAVLYCLSISILYVASLYMWSVPGHRNHPATVRARMLSVLLTCCVAWLPAWHLRRQLAERHPNSADLPELLQLLGLQVADPAQLLTDIAETTALTLVLFSGPLYHSATRRARQQTKEAAAGAAWQDAAGSSTPLLHQLRDIVVSPIAEEWCFRACMLPLLWMQGFGSWRLLLLTPLFFGLCHLHHGWGMVQWYGWSWRIPVLCCVQFLYTTVFGWYATWVFLATGSTAAAVLVHSLCNWMGLPAFGQMSRAHGLACVAGVAAFCWVAPRALRPSPSSAFWWRPCAAAEAAGAATL